MAILAVGGSPFRVWQLREKLGEDCERLLAKFASGRNEKIFYFGCLESVLIKFLRLQGFVEVLLKEGH